MWVVARGMGSRFSVIIWSIPHKKGPPIHKKGPPIDLRREKGATIEKGATHTVDSSNAPPIRTGWLWPRLRDAPAGCTTGRTLWVAPLLRSVEPGNSDYGWPLLLLSREQEIPPGADRRKSLHSSVRVPNRTPWNSPSQRGSQAGAWEPGVGLELGNQEWGWSLGTRSGAGAWERERGDGLHDEMQFTVQRAGVYWRPARFRYPRGAGSPAPSR
jgi:hypothetical protein